VVTLYGELLRQLKDTQEAQQVLSTESQKLGEADVSAMATTLTAIVAERKVAAAVSSCRVVFR
jgi:hypothetical protein